MIKMYKLCLEPVIVMLYLTNIFYSIVVKLNYLDKFIPLYL